MKKPILLLSFLVAVGQLNAQVLDSTFGVLGSFIPGVLNFYGTTACDFDDRDDRALSAIHLEDGRIILAGYTTGTDGNDFAMVRLLSDGKYDETVGPEGEVRIDLGYQNDSCLAATLYQSDWILMGGCVTLPGTAKYVNLIARVDLDGKLDPSFGNGGHITFDLPSNHEMIAKILPQSDGKIIMVGHALYGQSFYAPDSVTVYIGCLLPDGQIDSTFGANGFVYFRWKQESNASLLGDAVLDSNGRIILTGGAYHPYPTVFDGDFASLHNIIVRRFLPDGNRDTSFGINGARELLFTGAAMGTALDLYEDGRILVAGVVGNVSLTIPFYTYLTRLMPDGTTDISFGNNGSFNKFIVGGGAGSEPVGILRIQNKIILGFVDAPMGDHLAFGAVCLEDNGQIDSTFGNNGVYVYPIYTRYFINQISSTDPTSFFLSGYYRVLQPYNMVIMKLKLSETSITQEAPYIHQLKIYPNPVVADVVYVDLADEKIYDDPSLISVKDIRGRDVFTHLVQQGGRFYQMDVAHLQNGVYFVKVVRGGTHHLGKFVIQR